MSEETNLTPSEESKIQRIRDIAKRGPQSRMSQDTPQEPKVRFNGTEQSQRVAQKTLNESGPSDRMYLITQHAKYEVTERLSELRDKESLADGHALYQEYRECINDDFEDHDDFDVSYWVNSQYLETMRRRKIQTSYWENYSSSK